MNHQKLYQSINDKAASQNRKKFKKDQEKYIYYENHHIIPKCLGGTNDKENLILLTAKEHFVCHKLLTFIYKGNRKIANAFFKMSTIKTKKIIYNVSSKDYTYARELISLIPMSEEHKKNIAISNTLKPHYKSEKFKNTMRNCRKNFKHSEETKQKIKEKRKLQVSPMKNKYHTKEAKEKMSNIKKGKPSNFKGKHHNEESKKKLSESSKLLIGDKNSFFGKHHTKEAKEKNRLAHLGKIPWNKGLKLNSN